MEEYIDVEYREADANPNGSMEALPAERAGSVPAADSATYGEMVGRIKESLQSVKESFITVGYCLKTIKDHELYRQDPETPYNNIYEFAEHKLQISKSTASRLIKLCEEFSEERNSPRIAADYAGFNYSQLAEMAPMKPEDRERICPEMPVARIREEKAALREAERERKEEKRKEAAPGIPRLSNQKEREAWLKNVEGWEKSPWHEDKKIGAVYYKADFPDGCRLIAAKYRNATPDADGNIFGKAHYHMLYSEWHLLGLTQKEYEKKRWRNFADAETGLPELKKYLQKRMAGNLPDRRLVEFDTGRPEAAEDKDLPYLTQRYIEFYMKHGYVPKYFNAYNCSGDPEVAPTLTTSSGGYTGTGALATFSLEENLERIAGDQNASPDMRDSETEKLRKAAVKPEDGNPCDIGRIKFYVKRLTPEQAFELMGFTLEDFEKCRAMGLKDSELFHGMGNGIVPQVMSKIAKALNGAVDLPEFSFPENHGGDAPDN